MTSFAGKTALITGASAGMGVNYARELAAEGARLILVARRADRLEAIRSELQQQHGVDITVLPCDLADAEARQALYDGLKRDGVEVDLLINNAGLGLKGPFLDADWGAIQNMIQVDINALSHLSHLFGRDMKSRGAGDILLVASVVGHFAVPKYAAYSASKHYVRALGVALKHELQPHGVNVTTVSPGATATEFFDVAGDRPSRLVRRATRSSRGVVRAALAGLRAGKREVIPGAMNAMMAGLARLLPTALMTRMVSRVFG